MSGGTAKERATNFSEPPFEQKDGVESHLRIIFWHVGFFVVHFAFSPPRGGFVELYSKVPVWAIIQ